MLRYITIMAASLVAVVAVTQRSTANVTQSAYVMLKTQNPIDFNTLFAGQIISDGPVPNALRPFSADVSTLSTYPVSWEGGNAPAGVAAFIGLDVHMATEGWNYMWLTTGDNSLTDYEKAYGAGYLEGNITAFQIYNTILNTGANASWDAALEAFLIANTQFMTNNANNNTDNTYWYQVGLVLTQLLGLYDGYMDSVPASMRFGFRSFLNLQLSGDFDDLSAAIGLQTYGDVSAIPHYKSLHRHRQMARATGQSEVQVKEAASRRKLNGTSAKTAQYTDKTAPIMPTTDNNGHCSAIAKAIYDGSVFTELYIGQTAWSGFEDMLRIYKTYSFQFAQHSEKTEKQRENAGEKRTDVDQYVSGVVSSFSSYAGALFSGDDWYTLQPSGLVVLETTIGNSNNTLYELYVKPDTVMDWMRNIVANRLAYDAPSWAQYFSLYNSGTYNNEFFILDYKKFRPGLSSLLPDTLWLLDQAPGYINASDATQTLQQQTYLASYNVPAFPFIYAVTGAESLAAQFGPWFSWNDTARANIFRRDHVKVVDEDSFRALIRYNDFQHDPLSTQACSGNPPYSAENAIAARDDLNPASGVYPIDALGHRDHAAIDAKYTSWKYMDPSNTVSVIQAGPTYDQQPVFAWSTTSPDIAALAHFGMPDSFQMPWVQVQSPPA